MTVAPVATVVERYLKLIRKFFDEYEYKNIETTSRDLFTYVYCYVGFDDINKEVIDGLCFLELDKYLSTRINVKIAPENKRAY
jgi:hypothetical protein